MRKVIREFITMIRGKSVMTGLETQKRGIATGSHTAKIDGGKEQKKVKVEKI